MQSKTDQEIKGILIHEITHFMQNALRKSKKLTSVNERLFQQQLTQADLDYIQSEVSYFGYRENLLEIQAFDYQKRTMEYLNA